MPLIGSNCRRAAVFATSLSILALAAADRPAAPRGKGDDPTREWSEGPVRYLMNRSETRLFRTFETPAERIAFIRNFWERRDPDPRTPQNEARLVFWQRVSEANTLFTGTARAGWKTDRGKIYILLGPPDDIEKDENYDTGRSDLTTRGLMRWAYRGLPNAANRVVTVIAFVRSSDEDWRLSDDARFSSPAFSMLHAADQALAPTIDRLIEQVPWANGDLGTAMDLARLQQVPTERELLSAIVKAEQFLGTYEAQGTVHLLDGPAGETLVALTIALPRARLSPPWDGSAVGLASRFVVSAEVRPRDAAAAIPFEVPEEAFVPEPAPAPQDPWLRFQAVRPIPPGSWQVRAVVYDRPGGGAGAAIIDFSVPSPSGQGLRLHGPVPGTAEGAGERASDEPASFPFRAGPLRILPRPGANFRSSEPLRFVAFIEPPPGQEDTAVPLSWSIHADGLESAERAGGESADGRGAWQLELPAGSLGPGRYRLSLTVGGSGTPEVTREVRFEVSAGGPA